MHCQSFPELEQPQIPRDNIINTIEGIFEAGAKVVVMEGNDGIGKTTALAQFAMKHQASCLAIFLNSASRWGYDPTFLRMDLYGQMYCLLYPRQKDPSDEMEVNQGIYGKLLFNLLKFVRTRGKEIYFVVDGLDDIPDEDIGKRDMILELLPINYPRIRLLISGDSDRLKRNLSNQVNLKSSHLTGFTIDETSKYLSDRSLDQPSLDVIYRTCRGNPGYLSSVRRNLKSGVHVRELIDSMSDRLPDLFEIEWRGVGVDNELQRQLLAILAHDRRQHDIESLSRIVKTEPNDIVEVLKSLQFVLIEEGSQRVSFASEPFRKFAASRLASYRNKTIELLIDNLEQEPDSDQALTHLPSYLEQAGRLEQLLEYLSPEHFAKLLERSQSFGSVQQKADLGILTAQKLGREKDLMQFVIQKCAMIELGGAEIWRSEIEARMALDQCDLALALAQSPIVKEDRLYLLAVIAKAKREAGLTPEPELYEQMRQLYGSIDLAALGDRAIEIASVLIHSIPELAIEMVEKSTGTSSEENSLDVAFSKLSIAALDASSSTVQALSALESIRNRVKNPSVKDFSSAASLLVGDYTATEAIAECEKLSDTSTRVFLLREWSLKNHKRLDAGSVTKYALRLIIGTTEYIPNAQVYRELATPVPNLNNEVEAKELIGILDSQKVTVENLGPSEEFVRLLLLLTKAEAKYSIDSARNRIVEVYFYIDTIGDLSTKASCLAWLVATLDEADPKKELETKEGLHTLAMEGLKESLDALLKATADHNQVTRGIILALAVARPQMILDLVLSLNTEYRRDAGILDVVKAMLLQTSLSSLDLAFLANAINRIVDQGYRDDCVLLVIEAVATGDGELLTGRLNDFMGFASRIDNVQNSSERCRAYCLAYTFLAGKDSAKHEEMCKSLLSKLSHTWNAIDTGWEKVNVGYKIIRALAKTSLDAAHKYLELTEQFRNEMVLDAPKTARAYMACLQLSIRAFAGLLPKEANTQQDYDRITNLIDRIPSSGARAGLWTELALRCFGKGRLDICSRISSEYIRPLLRTIPEEDSGYKNRVLITASPALYFAHPQTALEEISKLPLPIRDEAYEQICHFILSKQPDSDPFEGYPRHGFDVTYEETVTICELLELIDGDSTIYSFIEKIADSVTSPRARSVFTQGQRSDMALRLERVISKKLPNPKHIRHDGYKIAARAQIGRIMRSKGQYWVDLINAARVISNLADRVYVLGIIAVVLPNSESKRQAELFNEAKQLIDQIPCTIEVVDHLYSLAMYAMDVDAGLCRECLNKAMKAAVTTDNPDVYKAQRRIVDLAHRLDPNLASTLASLADDDPARAMVRTRLNRQLNILDLKKKMVNELTSALDVANQSSDYPRAAWLLLGALNANRIETIRFERSREYLQIASSLPLSEAFPVLGWVTENSVRRFEKTDQARTHLRSIFEATLLGTELAGKMSARSTRQIRKAQFDLARTQTGKSILIKSGKRDEAILYVREWLAQNVREYLKICDPFFGPNDLELLQMLLSVNPACSVRILTSQKHQTQEGVQKPWDEAYRHHWRVSISDQDPPETELMIVGVSSTGELPVHDRWWLTKDGGLRLGTSFNSLGMKKDAEVSILTKDESEILEKQVDRYLTRIEREHNGERLLYTSFNL